MSRSTAEWTGRSDDTPVPPRIRAKVFKDKGGKCHRCSRIIDAAGGERWTCEHMIALINNGQNRESNLDVTCAWCLPIKNAEDVAEKSRAYRRTAKNIGVDLKPSRKRIQSAGFRKAAPQRSASRPLNRKSYPEVSA
jgi:5-methylcytosine-specific restriction endonuclease McrA